MKSYFEVFSDIRNGHFVDVFTHKWQNTPSTNVEIFPFPKSSVINYSKYLVYLHSFI